MNLETILTDNGPWAVAYWPLAALCAALTVYLLLYPSRRPAVRGDRVRGRCERCRNHTPMIVLSDFAVFCLSCGFDSEISKAKIEFDANRPEPMTEDEITEVVGSTWRRRADRGFVPSRQRVRR